MFGLFGGKRVIIRTSADGERTVEIKGKIAESYRARVQGFFEELPVRAGKVTIHGDLPHPVTLKFSRDFPTEFHQRVRNFLGNLA